MGSLRYNAHKHLNWGFKETWNLTTGERKPLGELHKDLDIVKKKKTADKENATVILDRDQYIWERPVHLGGTRGIAAVRIIIIHWKSQSILRPSV